MKSIPLFIPLVFLVLSVSMIRPGVSEAEPYIAVMEGAKCSLCHVNPTGAGMRREHGIHYYRELSLDVTKDLFDDEFRGRLTKYFAVGGDLRFRHLATIQTPASNTFSVPQGSLYLRAMPISHVTFYADTDIANVVNREAFGLIDDLPHNLWIKFGRIHLPYGFRIPDDSSFIRSDLGFTFGSQDLGLEAGIEPGPFSFAVAATNGVPGGNADDNEQKAVTTSGAWVTRHLRLGTSFQWNDQSVNRLLTGGGFLGVHFWRMAVLGELDVQNVKNKLLGGDRTVKAGYGEADLKIIPGLVFKGTYDFEDDQLPASGLHHRIGAGLEVYPLPCLEISTMVRMRIGPGALGQDQIFTQVHGYY